MNRQDRNRILLFIGITFSLTWIYCLFVIYPMLQGENLSGIPAVTSQLLVAVVMFFPSIGVILTRLITKEGFKDLWLKINFRKNLKIYFLAWFGPGILTFLGSGLYFLLFPGDLDLSFRYFTATLESSGASVDTIPISIGTLMLIQCVQGLFLAPILNFVTCFGEEWGWRGYLLPKMAKQFSSIPLLLITGIIWGLWHAPLTIIGHNYGIGYPGFPFTGIAMMCVFCTVLGVFLSYITMKSKSCIPAVLAHGAVNGIAAIGIYFTRDGGNPFTGPAPTGIIGIIPFAVVAAILTIQLNKGHNQ